MPVINLPEEIISRLNVLGLDILTTYQFAVDIDRVGGPAGVNEFLAGFTGVKGIGDRIEVREIEEGGYLGIHKFPQRSKLNSIELVRGMSFSRALWDWYNQVRNWTKGDPDYRRTLSVYILNSIIRNPGEPIQFEVWRFDYHKAWPSEWHGPTLDSMREEQAFERITIQHSGIVAAESLLSYEGVKNLVSGN